MHTANIFLVLSGGFSGARGVRSPPWASKFFRLHAVFAKIWQNCMLALPPPRELPAWENPGSAAATKTQMQA